VLNALRHRRWNQFLKALYAYQLVTVLNALRHRRWNQQKPVALVEWFFEVLNALRHRRWNQSFQFFSSLTILLCAQRLAASKMESGSVIVTDSNWCADVLNALRHRRWNQIVFYPYSTSRK